MNTLFDKIWDKHVVQIVPDGPTQLYIDRLYCHEVTSPQAFAGMRARGLKMFRPDQIFCMPDHNTPTHDQDKPIEDPISKKQVDTLAKNTADFGVTHFAMNTKDNGIIHVVGPEKGLSLPGMTIACTCNSPGSVLTGRTGAEVLASYEDDTTVRWVVHHEVWLWSSVGIVAPVAEEVVAHALFIDGLEETGWDDLVCIYILQRKRNAA